MNTMTTCMALIAAACTLGLSGCDSREREDTPAARSSQPAAQPTTISNTSTHQADNTGNNWDDTGTNAMTARDQSQSSEHVALTADVRQAILADDTLSMGAKNCKIITDSSGRVWLRGAVNSQSEKELIERIATRIAGEDTVTNELEVIED